MPLRLMESPLCSTPVRWAVWRARKFSWKMEQNPRVSRTNLLRYMKQRAKVRHGPKMWQNITSFAAYSARLKLALRVWMLHGSIWSVMEKVRHCLTIGPFPSKWASVRGAVVRHLSLREPVFADDSHYFWLTIYSLKINQTSLQLPSSQITLDLVFGPVFCVLCWALKHFLTCAVKSSFSYKSNRAWVDSLENYFALSLTDYCLHASLLPGHYGCVEALVTWGADVDMDIPHLGTALYTACICQELECARKLLREGQLAELCRCLQKSPLWTYGLEHKDYKHKNKLIYNKYMHAHRILEAPGRKGINKSKNIWTTIC